MTVADIALLALGPAIALSAGLIIYGLGVSTPEYRAALRKATEATSKADRRS